MLFGASLRVGDIGTAASVVRDYAQAAEVFGDSCPAPQAARSLRASTMTTAGVIRAPPGRRGTRRPMGWGGHR